VAGELGGRMAAALGAHGTLIAYGRLAQQPLALDTGGLLFRGATVRGFWLTRWFQESRPAHVQETIGTVLGLMARGVLDPPVAATYDLADVREAAAHAERPGRAGKVLLTG
jgi:NADPH:quinone reductase-like Zn-dependent oxidoreductase